MAALLEMKGIVKRFGAVTANDGVNLRLERGEILGLLGENGSGKSTLMKALFGMIAPDEGEIWLNGALLRNYRPSDAIGSGIAMIHQHFMLIEAMSVVENVMLGWSDAGRVLKRGEMAKRVREASRRFHLELEPDDKIADLPLGRRQRVEILKAVLREADLLILDEPTSNLAPSEVADLIAILRRLRSEGKGVIFISHKLPEVLEVCDRVTVLRAGRVAGEATIGSVTRAQLAEMMVGRDLTAPFIRRSPSRADVRLQVEGLQGPGLGPISFEVRGREILGVAGVDGNGQIELAETLAGLRRPRAGAIRLDGRDVTGAHVAGRVRMGVAYMPADRSSTALVKSLSIGENLMLRDSSSPAYAEGPFISTRRLEENARRLMREYDIRAPDPATPAGRLSGGNQQKIVVARELDRAPAALIAHQAAWGLDPGATRFVLERVLALREQGGAIVYFSSELEEVLEVADRVAVMANGVFAGVTARADADLAEIGLWMSGRPA